jgi:hypothetical protein
MCDVYSKQITLILMECKGRTEVFITLCERNPNTQKKDFELHLA